MDGNKFAVVYSRPLFRIVTNAKLILVAQHRVARLFARIIGPLADAARVGPPSRNFTQ